MWTRGRYDMRRRRRREEKKDEDEGSGKEAG
jgi:hypothetical protein